MIPAGHPTRWPQGRSREQTCYFVITDGAPDATLRAKGQLTALAHGGRAQPAPHTLVECNQFEMPLLLRYQAGDNVRIHRAIHSLCQLQTVADKWNLGDTIETGYSLSYAGIPNRLEKLPGAPDLQPRFTPHGTLHSPALLPFIEPVWTNNEYDVIHALAQELCRTGNNDVFTLLRWVARHNIEVDFLAYNDDRWHHRATPAHSQHHNETEEGSHLDIRYSNSRTRGQLSNIEM